jgi:hypothetical protein
MYSLSILSLPADLPFFNFCTTDFISSAVLGEFGERLSIIYWIAASNINRQQTRHTMIINYN